MTGQMNPWHHLTNTILPLVNQCCAYHVSAQIDTENGDGTQWKRDVGDDEQEEGGDLRNVTSQGVGDGLLQVVEDQTT